jgi:hypothetical protein
MRLPWAVSMREKVVAFKHVGSLAKRARVCYKDGAFASGTVCLDGKLKSQGSLAKPRIHSI